MCSYLNEYSYFLGNVDYNSISVTLTFDDSTSTACTEVNILGDNIPEGDELFTLTLSTEDDSVTISDDSDILTIEIADDDGVFKCFFVT